MANFTALKTAINNAIKTNGNEEITGAILQAILDAMVETLGDSAINDLENAITTEVTNRENAVGDVATDLAAEALARANKDNQLDGRINQEEYNRANADAALSRTVDQGFQTLNSQMTALNAAISALNAAYQNGYLYGGIATPSSSPSNNKCFYIALQGGTYTNFGGVGVVEGINIIKNDSGWKVEHIYDQTTLLNEFYLLRQQVIQAITSFAPIVIEGDVTNAPDEEDLTSNANHLLQFKNNAYSPLEFSGLGRKYLRKNIAPLSESAPFNGFVEGVTAEETLSGTPEYIFWDRMNTRFVGIKDGVYYVDWTGSDNYVPVSTSLVYMYNGTPYQWTGSDFIVDESEVPNLVNCLTQDMINEANTIYIIRYDYTLKENITIPANCVLEFDGGSISGDNVKILSFNGAFIQSPNREIFKDIVFDGAVSNGMFNAIWVYGNDIGESVNIAATYFKKICLPADNYTFTTPILLDHCSLVEMLGFYTYNGILTNGMALVKFNECRAAYLRFGRLGISNAVSAELSHDDDRTKNIIGVNIDNSANTILFVQSVTGVNEGIRVSATETNGGDCFIEATTLVKNNIGIRIYQQNGSNFTPGNWQFVNDTNIRVNYCNAQLTGCTTYGVVVAGPAFDNASYKDPNVVDSYDNCSGVVIEGGDYEGNAIGFYCRNCEISIQNAREEGLTTFLKAVGKLKLNYVPKYINSISKIDFSECTTFTPNGLPNVSYRGFFDINVLSKRISTYDYICPYNYIIFKENASIIRNAIVFYNECRALGVVVENFSGSGIIHIKTKVKTFYDIVYLDDEDNNVSANYRNPKDRYFFSYGAYHSPVAYNYDTIVIPAGVHRVFIGVSWGTVSTPINNTLCIEAYTDANFSINNNPIVLSGTTRPAALPKNVPFFDESLSPTKPIWWNGTEYVDAIGATV